MKSSGVIAHNSTYVYRRSCGAVRATRRCGAPLRHMALHPGWARGHINYVRFVMRNCAKSAQDMGSTITSRHRWHPYRCKSGLPQSDLFKFNKRIQWHQAL